MDPFDSVGRFLEHVQQGKARKRQVIDGATAALLNDPATFSMPPASADLLGDTVERFGDEALKQHAIVALGKWATFHQEWLDQHIAHEKAPEAALTASDLTKIVQAIKIIEDVGSFGGDEDYRKAMKEQINQAILEGLEENGCDPEEVFRDSPFDDPLL